MLAFTNTTVTKAELLAQLQLHHDADEIVKGHYWEEGKGCAVGCAIHSGNHAEYEPRFGIPEALAQLEDAIFEGLPNGEAKKFPLQFVEAIRPGADLSKVQYHFCAWILADPEHGVIRFAGNPEWGVAAAVQTVADLCARMATDDVPAEAEWSAAESAAESARRAAESARRAAESGAESARSAAESASWSARSAARSAAESASWSARSAAESASYQAMRDKLLELLRAA